MGRRMQHTAATAEDKLIAKGFLLAAASALSTIIAIAAAVGLMAWWAS